MKLFEKLAELKEPVEEPEVIIRDAPKTEGQKWFEKNAKKRKQELTKRKE